MSVFVELDDESKVISAIVIGDADVGIPMLSFPETESVGRVFIANTLGLSGNWRQTSEDGLFRKRYAGIGFYFDAERDEFVPPGFELVDGEWTEPPQTV